MKLFEPCFDPWSLQRFHGSMKQIFTSRSGWWFGTFFIFHNIWDVILPNWRTPSFLHVFRGVGQPPDMTLARGLASHLVEADWTKAGNGFHAKWSCVSKFRFFGGYKFSHRCGIPSCMDDVQQFSVSSIASDFLEFSPKISQRWSVVHFERYGRHWTLCSPRSKVGDVPWIMDFVVIYTLW